MKNKFFKYQLIMILLILLSADSFMFGAEEHISSKIKKLASVDVKKRLAAAEDIAAMGKNVLPYLLPYLKPSEEKRLRIGVLLAVKKIGPEASSAAGRIVEIFKERDSDIRFAAVDALVWLKADPAFVLQPLIELLHDKDLRIRYVAATAIGRFGERAEEAVPFLLQSLEGGNAQAARAVGDIGYKGGKVYETLVSALKAENYLVRAQAIKTVGKLFQKKAIDNIKGRLADNSSYVSKTAERTLLSIDPELKSDIEKIKEKIKRGDSVDSSDSERAIFIINPLPELKKEIGDLKY